MSDSSMFPLAMQARIRSRSMGVKLIVVCGLALLMTIPALFVGGLVEDRTTRAAEVVNKITRTCRRPADISRTDPRHPL